MAQGANIKGLRLHSQGNWQITKPVTLKIIYLKSIESSVYLKNKVIWLKFFLFFWFTKLKHKFQHLKKKKKIGKAFLFFFL